MIHYCDAKIWWMTGSIDNMKTDDLICICAHNTDWHWVVALSDKYAIRLEEATDWIIEKGYSIPLTKEQEVEFILTFG